MGYENKMCTYIFANTSPYQQHNSGQLLVEAADPRDAICSEVEKNKVDVLVLGTRGLGTLKRYIII